MQEITRSRRAAIAVLDEGTEKPVAIIELKKRGEPDEDAMHKLAIVRVKSPRGSRRRMV